MVCWKRSTLPQVVGWFGRRVLLADPESVQFGFERRSAFRQRCPLVRHRLLCPVARQNRMALRRSAEHSSDTALAVTFPRAAYGRGGLPWRLGTVVVVVELVVVELVVVELVVVEVGVVSDARWSRRPIPKAVGVPS